MSCCNSNCNHDPCGSAFNQSVTMAAQYAQYAQTQANKAEDLWLEFNALYLGSFAVAPTTDNEGNPLQEGALYFNSVSNQMFVWQGGSWIDFDFDEFTPFLATGTTATRNLVTRFTDVANVKDFGAIGDGVADDTAAIQAAINSLNGAGRVYVPPGRYYLANTLTIKPNVFLDGAANNVSEDNVAHDYDSFKNILFLNPTATISLNDGATIKGFQILSNNLKNNLPFPNTAAALASIATWTGTAITQNGSDVKVENCFIGGFFQAFNSNSRERTKINWVNIDCINGVLINASYDIARIENTHAWPFLTTHQSALNNTTYIRSGSAFKTTTQADATQFISCFSYGYDIGFDIQTRTSCTLLSCYTDSASYGTGQIGFKISSGAEMISIIGGGVSGLSYGILINCTPSTYGRININGMGFWGNYEHLVSEQHLHLNITNCCFRDTNGGSRIAIRIAPGNTGRTNIVGNIIDTPTTAYNIGSNELLLTQIISNSVRASSDNVGQKLISDNTSALITTSAYNSNNTGHALIFEKYRGSAISPVTANANDVSGNFIGRIYNGSSVTDIAGMRFTVRGTPSSTSTAGAIIFGTTSPSQTTSTDRIVLNENGNLIPVVDDAYTLGALGQRYSSVWAANGTIQTSDEREKKDVKSTELGLDFINALNPVSYKWKVGGQKVIRQVYRDADGNEVDPTDDNAIPSEIITEKIEGHRTHHGLLAQEVKAALPEGVDFGGWVLTDKDNPDSQQALRYDQFIAPIIKAVKELSQENTSLKQRIEALEAK